MFYLLALILPIISFALQSYPRLFNKYYGVDVWKRMIEADLVRKNNHRIPRGLIKEGFILEGYFDYPTIFPWLLSFLSKKDLLKYQGFIAPIFDSLQNLAIFIITFQITGRIEISLFAQLIYTIIPLTILENSYLTPRSLGYLNFTLAFFPLLLYSLNARPYYLLVAFIFTTLIFFTHRFAMQALLFIIIFFSIIDNSFLYLMVFGSSLITALVISKGYYFRILEGHLAIISFWIKNYKYRFSHQIRGLREEKKKMDFVGFVYFLLSKYPPIALTGTNLWLLGPFFLFIAHLIHFSILPQYNPDLLFKMSLWVVFFYILSNLVLSNKHLIPIGEGQRYLEMAIAPTAIISSIIFFRFLDSEYKDLAIGIYILIFITNIIVTLYAQLKGILRDKNRSLTQNMDKVFKYINKIKPKARVLCIPHQICGLVLFNTKAKVLVDVQLKDLIKIDDVYPILKLSVKDVAKKYKLNILILKKTYASMDELNLNKSDLLFETDDTQVFKIGNISPS